MRPVTTKEPTRAIHEETGAPVAMSLSNTASSERSAIAIVIISPVFFEICRIVFPMLCRAGQTTTNTFFAYQIRQETSGQSATLAFHRHL
jgi:hypothetical protein